MHSAHGEVDGMQQEAYLTSREMSSILQRIPDIVYRLDTAGRVTYVNEAVRRYGYDPSKMAGTHLLDYVHPQDRQRAAHRLNERRTGDRRTKALEIRLLISGSMQGLTEHPVRPVFREPVLLLHAEGLYEDGLGVEHFVGTQGIARDITDRRSSEEKYATVFRAAPIGVAVTKCDDARILDVNEEFQRILGYRHDEFIGRSAFEIGAWVNPEERAHIVSLLRKGEPAQDLEVQWRTKSRDVRTVRLSGRLIDLGGVDYLVTTGVDISERQRERTRTWRRAQVEEERLIPEALSVLTLRELQVCLHVSRGLSSKEIARLMGISFRSVETHRSHIRRKLHVEGKNLFVHLQRLLGRPFCQ
jgi:PAS domain S-box-containing protein